MSIKRLNGAGIYGSKSNKAWDQTTTLNDFQSIATVVVPSGGQASVTFSNIPQNFSHLQIRFSGLTSAGGNSTIQFNGDSGSNYTYHYFRGLGSSIQAGGTSSAITQSYISYLVPGAGNASITDILDYSSVNKNKTIRSLTGYENNTGGIAALLSGVWLNSSSAITSITIACDSGNYSQYSTFALYGIKVAS